MWRVEYVFRKVAEVLQLHASKRKYVSPLYERFTGPLRVVFLLDILMRVLKA